MVRPDKRTFSSLTASISIFGDFNWLKKNKNQSLVDKNHSDRFGLVNISDQKKTCFDQRREVMEEEGWVGAYCPYGSGVLVGGKIFVGGGVFCLVFGDIFLRRLVGLVWQENLFFVGW